MTEFETIRKKLGYTREEMAKKLGVKIWTIITYERRVPKKVMDKMRKLAKNK